MSTAGQPGEGLARAFGGIAAFLRRSGRKSGARAPDAMIAATATAKGLPVYTCNLVTWKASTACALWRSDIRTTLRINRDPGVALAFSGSRVTPCIPWCSPQAGAQHAADTIPARAHVGLSGGVRDTSMVWPDGSPHGGQLGTVALHLPKTVADWEPRSISRHPSSRLAWRPQRWSGLCGARLSTLDPGSDNLPLEDGGVVWVESDHLSPDGGDIGRVDTVLRRDVESDEAR